MLSGNATPKVAAVPTIVKVPLEELHPPPVAPQAKIEVLPGPTERKMGVAAVSTAVKRKSQAEGLTKFTVMLAVLLKTL